MSDNIEGLLSAYERGAFTRRQFVAAVSALLSVPAIGCRHHEAQSAGPFVARGINHVTISVKDLTKSREFYQWLFKFARSEEGGQSYFLGMGSTFLALDALPHVSGVDHFCIGIDGFDLNGTKQKLESLSVNATIEEGRFLYFRDPDGVKVQLSAADYQG